MRIVLQLILLIIGFVLLIKGADFFVDGAGAIARKFKIPQLIIGLTIVAMGTSAPETAVSLTAAFKGNADITIGNVVGSNILNVLIVLGVTASITSLPVGKSTIRVELPFTMFISALFMLLGMDGMITLADGVILIILFVLYIAYLIWSAKKNPEEIEEIKELPLWKALVATVGGLALVVFGSDLTVDAAKELARFFGMSDRFIGLTVVALGTSLPELVTSATAARKGNADMAIGNIVGSNIFNILFVVGLSALVIPIPFASAFRSDMLVATLAVVLLWLCCCRSGKIKRWGGVLMLACYAAYFISIC